jgi:hypothetical protein
VITAAYVFTCDGGCGARLDLPLSDLRRYYSNGVRGKPRDEAIQDAKDKQWSIIADPLQQPPATYCPRCSRAARLANETPGRQADPTDAGGTSPAPSQ